MTDDEREKLANILEGGAGYSAGKPAPLAQAAAQLRADGAQIKALEEALAGLVGLYDDPALPGEDYQDEIDRRLRQARDVLNAARERQGGR